MANNYTQTSFSVGGITPPERTWLEDNLKEADRQMEEDDNYDEYSGISYEFEEDDDGGSIWFYSDESFVVEPLVNLLQNFLATFRPAEYIKFEWAHTCSKPRLDEFSGGGVFITAEKQKWFSPWYLIGKEVEKFEKKRPKTETTT